MTRSEIQQEIVKAETLAETLRDGLNRATHPLPPGAIDAKGLMEMALQDQERIIEFYKGLL
jgi:hypothetical protein